MKTMNDDSPSLAGAVVKLLCVGVPKSGTTSIKGMFSKYFPDFKSAHEPERGNHVTVLHKHKHGKLGDDELLKWYTDRKRRMDLDLESNCFLNYRYDLVSQIYHGHRIILTVRSPKAWLASILNNNMRFPASKSAIIAKYHDILFDPMSYAYNEKDSVLAKYNLYPVDAYLRYWVRANEAVMKHTEKGRLLVVKTDQLSHRGTVDRLFRFAGWSNKSAASSSASVDSACRLNVAPKDFKILEQIDGDFLENRIDEICGPTVRKLSYLIQTLCL